VLTPTDVFPTPGATGPATAPMPSSPGIAGPGYGAGGGYAPGTYGTAGYGTPGYGYGYSYGPPTPRTNGLAIASLVCSIVSLGCGGIVLSIPAVVMGHLARRSIRDSGGTEQGDGMALAGLIIGYIVSALTVLLIIFYVVIVVAAVGSSSTR
jgi:hypothetical protein